MFATSLKLMIRAHDLATNIVPSYLVLSASAFEIFHWRCLPFQLPFQAISSPNSAAETISARCRSSATLTDRFRAENDVVLLVEFEEGRVVLVSIYGHRSRKGNSIYLFCYFQALRTALSAKFLMSDVSIPSGASNCHALAMIEIIFLSRAE